MTSFHTSMAILFLIGSLLADSLLAQQTGDQDAFKSILKSAADGLADESIDEILEIRKQLGGGTGLETHELFDFSSTGCQGSERLPCCPSALASTLPDCPDCESAATYSERLFFSMLQPDPARCRNEGGLPATDNAMEKDGHVRQIRDIARRLEQLAADLEDLDLFTDADSLRSRAARLRFTARAAVTAQLDSSPIRR